MRKLSYFGFKYFFTEMQSNQLYNQLLGGKIISNYWQKENDTNYFNNILYQKGRKKNPSYIQPLEDDFILYTYQARPHVKELDDIMSSPETDPYVGFYISPKVKNLLDNSNIPSTKYYPTKISFKNREFQYYFAAISRENSGISFDKSIFIDLDNKIRHLNELKDIITEEMPTTTLDFDISAKKIVFFKEMDIFPVIASGSSHFYFSKRLKDTFINEGITGIKMFEESEIEFYLDDSKF